MAGISRRTFLGSAAVAGVGLPSFAAGHVAPLAQFPYTSIQFPDGPQRTQREQTHAVLMNLSEDSLLRPFRQREGLPAPGNDLGGWYNTYAFAPAHCYGQWMSALARYYAITGDLPTRAKISSLVRGYAATIDPTGKFFVENRFPAYTYDKLVLGLIDAHEYAHDPDALPTLARATDAVSTHLPPRSQPHATGPITAREEFTIHGWDESYTMAENQFLAWERTGLARHREMASRFLADDDYFNPLSRGENVLPGRHAYSHMNSLSSAAKAYLTLGSEKHFLAAKNGFRFVDEQSFATGGWGPDETFVVPGSGKLGESLEKTHSSFETPCGSYAHFKLTRYLLRATRDARYGDSMERVMYNTVLGARPLEANGSAFYYSDYNFAGKKVFHPDKFPCCAGTLPQIATDYGISTYFRDVQGIFVNLYIPSTLNWVEQNKQLRLVQTTNYPLDGAIQLALTAPGPVRFAVRLRIPEWAGDQARVSVNGKRAEVEAQGGTFAVLDRTWNPGDRIELELPTPMRLSAVDAQHPDTVALVRGPLVLFALGAAPTGITRKELLGAQPAGGRRDEWVAGGMRLRPFTSIGDEGYSTYVRVRSEHA